MFRTFKHKENGNIEIIQNDILVSALLREGYEEITEKEEATDEVQNKKSKK